MKIIKCASMPNISATSEPNLRVLGSRQIEIPSQIDRFHDQNVGQQNPRAERWTFPLLLFHQLSHQNSRKQITKERV